MLLFVNVTAAPVIVTVLLLENVALLIEDAVTVRAPLNVRFVLIVTALAKDTAPLKLYVVLPPNA